MTQSTFQMPQPGDSHSGAGRWSYITGLLTICQRSLRGQLAAQMSKKGVSQPQLFVLLACGQAPPEGLVQNELASSLALSAAHVSGLVEQLREAGLLVGKRSAGDRRRKIWRLTKKGHAKLTALLSELGDWARRLDSQMDADNREQLVSLLEALADDPGGSARSAPQGIGWHNAGIQKPEGEAA